MHFDVTSEKPGKCSKCGMNLVKKSKESMSESKNSYLPLIVIIGLILLSSIFTAYPDFQIQKLIKNFMIGFFLIFSGFKMVDLNGFAQGYSTYDVLAKKWFSYGYVYPFIELAFGFLMILKVSEAQVLIAEIVVMTFSGVGVLIKLLKREKFQCVCLGTFLKVPLTYVTLIEDFGMAFLASVLLLTS